MSHSDKNELGRESLDSPDGSPYIADDPTWWVDFHGYNLRFEMKGVPSFEYMLVNLGAVQDSTDIATLRMVRARGPNDADLRHRRNLFSVVGAIVVAGGHIEAEMKRIVIMGEDRRAASFTDVDLTWTQLEERLDSIVASGGPLSREIAEATAWGRTNRIKKRRDDAVHGAWTLYDVGSVQLARFERKSSAAVQVGKLEDFVSTVAVMWEYAARLSTVGTWPTAILPPLEDLPVSSELRLDWACGSPTVEAHSPHPQEPESSARDS